MEEEKGITLIALVITIIIMLILVGATITILTQGEIINKAQNAVIGTDTAQKNETNRMNELGAEIEAASRIDTQIITPEHTVTSFVQGQTYSQIFLNPTPRKLQDLLPAWNMEDTLYFNFDKISFVYQKENLGGDTPNPDILLLMYDGGDTYFYNFEDNEIFNVDAGWYLYGETFTPVDFANLPLIVNATAEMDTQGVVNTMNNYINEYLADNSFN